MVKNGNFVSHFEGFHGLNQTKKWIIEEWNKDKGTKHPIPQERVSTKKAQAGLDFKAYHAINVPFNESFDNSLNGADGFNNDLSTAELVNNVLYSKGKYSSKTSQSTLVKDFDKGNFSLYLEFMPHLSVNNNIICLDRSYRDFSLVIWENKLGFRFDNGAYAYLEEEIEIEKFQWNAVALSYDYKAKELQVVLNGKKLKNFKVDEHIKINPNSYATFSVTNFSNGNVFKGYLDDFNLYTTALKDKNLMDMYKAHAGEFTDMTSYLPQDMVAEFKFDGKKNEVNDLEELIVISDEFNNMPIVLTEALPVDPRDITIAFDFNNNQLLNFAEVFELEGKYGHNYINFNIIDGDIQVVLDFYSDDKEYKALRYETQNKPIKENKWYNFVLSFNEKEKQLYVYLNGEEVMNKKYSSEVPSTKNSDYSKIIFQKHTFKGSTFTGYVDNLKMFSKAFTPDEVNEFYAKHRDHIAVSVAELSHEPTASHHDRVGFKLHEWSDNDYNEFDYDEFSNIIAINQPIDPSNFDQNLMNACIFYHTNYQRKKFGKQPFTYKSALENAATMHSTDMTLYGFFDHINHYDNKKTEPQMRIARFGITEGATSENIATRFESNISYWFLAAQFVQQWMDSPSHRRNILDDRMNSLGCGVALLVDEDDSHSVSYYGTQNFSSIK